MDETSDLLDTKAAAALLGFHPVTLAQWRVQGVGPRYRRIGPRRIRYHRDDLHAFLENAAREPGGETRG